MKRSLLIVLTFMSFCLLMAEFSNPVLISSTQQGVLFSGKNGFATHLNHFYLTYLEKSGENVLIQLSVSDNYGRDYTTLTLDSYPLDKVLTAPTLAVNENNIGYVFYQKYNEINHQYEIHCQKFQDQQILANSVIPGGLKEGIEVNANGDKFYLNFKDCFVKQMCYYQYFTNTDKTNISDGTFDDAAIVIFWGKDALTGRVHSNSDIRIQNAGTPPSGAPNLPNWPWFKKKLSTTGIIRVNPSGNPAGIEAPMDQIFVGGYEELVRKIQIENPCPMPGMLTPFGSTVSQTQDIVKVVINGNAFTSWIGDIRELEVRPFTVYYSDNGGYPDAIHPDYPLGDSVWTNYVVMKDTLWIEGPSGTVNNQAVYVPAVLWIEGNISGKQVWYSEKDAFTTGNITYTNTVAGEAPDDPDNPNLTDYFGLVSNKSIFIKYKYRIKKDGITYFSDANSQGPNGHVYLYGAYAALGKKAGGHYGYKQEGVFSYEYQHPHGASIPFIDNQGVVHDYIDLHRFKYPPDVPNSTGPMWTRWPNLEPTANTQGYPTFNTYAYPWYNTVDYPWYNPVWPESFTEITFERGTLHVFGSITQMRKGFIHRSGTVNYANPDMGLWDVQNGVYGPGHNSSGYNRDYHHDSRLENNPFPLFPYAIANENRICSMVMNGNGDFSGTGMINNRDDYKTLVSDVSEGRVVLMYNMIDGISTDSLYIAFADEENLDFTRIALNPDLEEFVLTDLKVIADTAFALINYGENLENCKIMRFRFSTLQYTFTELVAGKIVLSETIRPSLIKTRHDHLLVHIPQSLSNKIYRSNGNGFEYLTEFNVYDIDNGVAGYHFFMGETDSLYFLIHTSLTDNAGYDWSKVYVGRAYLDGITPNINPELPLPGEMSVKLYPNPFNPETTIELNLPVKEQVKVAVFNVKGQKVKTLHQGILEKGEHKLIFKGKDDKGRTVSSGLYFIRVQTSEKSYLLKSLLLK